MKNDLATVMDEISEMTRMYSELKNQIASSGSELSEFNSRIQAAKSELIILDSKKGEKEKEIMRAKNELAFIQLELANIGKDEDKKIINATSSTVSIVNVKYEDTKKEFMQ